MRKLLTRLLAIGAVVGMFLGITTITMASSYAEWLQSVKDGADFLLQYQNNDDGFPWRLTSTQRASFDGTGTSPNNTQGATARGLVSAYQATGDTTYLDAANKVADLIEYRYDNNISIEGYDPPFYNKDVEFAHELAAIGGNDITAKANQSAIDYFNEKLNDYSGNLAIDTAAKAVHQRYIDSGWATPGAQMWMLGNWVHVGKLLDTEEIESGYTGNDFASELYGLIETDYGTYFDPNTDTYATLGEFGVLEGAYFATNTAGSTDSLTSLKTKMQNPDSYFSFQDLGYTTYILGLLDDPAAMTGSQILMDWQDPSGGWIYSSGNWYGEGQGEVLLGLANNPVPEPGTVILIGFGLLGLVGYGIHRKKKNS